jgi:hypothetical protein
LKRTLLLLPLCAMLIAGTARADSDEHREYAGLSSAKFYGIIDALPQNSILGTWLINGRQVAVTRGTEIEQKRGRIAPGVYVKVEGHHSGSMFVAEEIEVKRGKRRS